VEKNPIVRLPVLEPVEVKPLDKKILLPTLKPVKIQSPRISRYKFHVPAWLEIELYVNDRDNSILYWDTKIYIDPNDWDDWFYENVTPRPEKPEDLRKIYEELEKLEITPKAIRERLKTIEWA